MKILFTDFVQPDLELEKKIIDEAGLEMCVASPQCENEDDVIQAVKVTQADAIISLYVPLTDKVFSALPNLKIVSVPLVGVDSIDLQAATMHGVWIAHIPDAWVVEVGVHAASMALSLIRHLPFYDRSVRERRWDYEEPGVLHRPSTMSFGLLGCGRIGTQTAMCVRASFGRIIAYDPHAQRERWPDWIEPVDTLDELFKHSDVVSLHSPLTEETRHIVSSKVLGLMKKGSYIINASRGALIDPQALLQALDSGQIGGAALDVFESEPPHPDDPLLHHPRTLISPHAAYYSIEADIEGRSRAVKNVISFMQTGQPDHYIVKGTR